MRAAVTRSMHGTTTAPHHTEHVRDTIYDDVSIRTIVIRKEIFYAHTRNFMTRTRAKFPDARR
jgi:hypothetical protein